MSSIAGTRVGPYEILAPLGAGGMGEVYRARDPRLDRLVALKLLPADVAHNPERLARFEREARAASALNHPAIVTIYDVGSADERPWISMELVDGETLRARLASGPLPLRRALAVAAQLADGLAKAHEAGIVHRDLKPENVMVTADGYAKILDFGLARLSDPSDAAATRPAADTRPGAVMGTLAYMSPEQAAGAVVDFRSDQFSFGAVLYEMLTGARAFERSSSVDTLSAILRDDPRPLGELDATIPAPVRWIVERCVEKRVADRYGSTRDLARDLANARDHLSEMSAGAGIAAVDARRAPVAMRRRERLAWALAVLLPLITAGVLLRSPTAPDPLERPSALRLGLPAPEGGTIVTGKFAVSPDGRQIAVVVSKPDGSLSLWLRSLDSLSWQELGGTEGASDPFWAPDGRAIGFFAAGKLKRVSTAGGGVHLICDASTPVGGTWGRDDIVVFGLQSGLHRVSASGGTPTRITSLGAAGDDVDFWPFFLPDGRSFVFSRIGGERSGIYFAGLDTAGALLLKRFEVRDVTVVGFSEPNFILFVEGGALLAQALNADRTALTGDVIHLAENIYIDPPATSFSVSPTGRLAFWAGGGTITELRWVRRDGTRIGDPVARGAISSFSLSGDGHQLAVGRNDTTPASIWTYDLERRSNQRITFDHYAQVPVWSPDGKRLAFGSARESPPNLYTTTIGGAQESERLTRSTLVEFPANWSPDGSYLLFTRVDLKNSYDLWVLPVSGDRIAKPLLNTRFAEAEAAVSPTGRWLAYSSDESGQLQVYATSFPTPGTRSLISTAGGVSPEWSADGRELFYRDRERIMAVGIKPGAGIEAGVPKILFEIQNLPPSTEQRAFRVARDGRFLVNVVVERISPPLTVVSDWRAGLVK